MLHIDFDLDAIARDFRALMAESPEGERMFRRIVRKAIGHVASGSRKHIRQAFPQDRRQMWKALRTSVWKRALGGVVTIAGTPRRSGGKSSTPSSPRRSSGRGGNRRPVSAQTLRMRGYQGTDLLFLLRWLDAGTDFRYNQPYRGANGVSGKIRAFRGRLKARNFFEAAIRSGTSDLEDFIAKAMASEIEKQIKG